mmetsp:Transcript_137/g.447  ORF Transcript_137/g.447 Transcript_137/m.447 type:complete len:253 (+) Transcript_137:639-1397(+)
MGLCGAIAVAAGILLRERAVGDVALVDLAAVAVGVAPRRVVVALAALLLLLLPLLLLALGGREARGGRRSRGARPHPARARRRRVREASRRAAEGGLRRALAAAPGAELAANVPGRRAAVAKARGSRLRAGPAADPDPSVCASSAGPHHRRASQGSLTLVAAHRAQLRADGVLLAAHSDLPVGAIPGRCQPRAAIVLRDDEIAVGASAWTLVHAIAEFSSRTNGCDVLRARGFVQVQGRSMLVHGLNSDDDL